MPDDVLNQDDIDSLLTEMNAEEKGAKRPANPAPAAPARKDAKAWGLSDDEINGKSSAGGAKTAAEGTARDLPLEPFGTPGVGESTQVRSLEFVLDIPLVLAVEVGRTRMTIGDLLSLGPGSIVELQKLAGEPLEVYVNDKLVARGEAVIVNEKFGVRLTDVISKSERIESLK